MANDDDRMSTWRHVVGGRKESPAIGGEAEHIEEVASDEIAEGAIRAVAGIQAGGESRPGRHAVKRVVPLRSAVYIGYGKTPPFFSRCT